MAPDEAGKLHFPSAADGRIRDCLRQIYLLPDVEKVVVYGSYAKGIPTDESDIDVAVFFSLPESEMLGCYRQLVRICTIGDVDIQVQAFPSAELEEPCGIIEEIIRYGVEIRN